MSPLLYDDVARMSYTDRSGMGAFSYIPSFFSSVPPHWGHVCLTGSQSSPASCVSFLVMACLASSVVFFMFNAEEAVAAPCCASVCREWMHVCPPHAFLHS